MNNSKNHRRAAKITEITFFSFAFERKANEKQSAYGRRYIIRRTAFCFARRA
jgi:hypothetical protein